MEEVLERLPTIGFVNVTRTTQTHSDRLWLRYPSSQYAAHTEFYDTYSWDVTFATFVGDAPELVPCCDSMSDSTPQTLWSTIPNDAKIQVYEKQKGSGEAIYGYFEAFLSSEEGSFSSSPIDIKSGADKVIEVLRGLPSLSSDISVDVVADLVDSENMVPKFQITLANFPEGIAQPIFHVRAKSCGPSVESTSSTIYKWNAREVQRISVNPSVSVVSCHTDIGKGLFSFVTSSTSAAIEGLIEAVIEVETGLPFYGEVKVNRELNDDSTNWVITFLEKAGNLDELICDSNTHVSTILNGTTLSREGSKFSLEFGGEESPPIYMNATSEEVRTALESLSALGQGSIEVSEEYYGSWLVTFVGAMVDGDVKLMQEFPSSESIMSTKVDVTEVIHGNELRGSYRLKVGSEWSDPIPISASAQEIESIMNQMDCISYVNITLINDQNTELIFDVDFPFYIGKAPNGFIPWTAQNMALMDVDSDDLEGLALQVSVETLVEGTEPIRNDDYSRGFRVVTPGGSKNYPLTQVTQWLQYNESADGMKRALEDAGGLPHGFTVTRKGPYENGSYKWEVILPKGVSFKNDTFWVVDYGGGQMRLQGDNAGVVARLKVLGTEPAGGKFSLNFPTAEGVETRNIPYDAADEVLVAAIESMSGIGHVTVDSKSMDYSQSGNGAKRWDVTFLSLQNAGDFPQLEANFSELSGSSAKIIIEENRKGRSNEVMMFHVGKGRTFEAARFRIFFRGHSSRELELGASAEMFEGLLNEIYDGQGRFYVDRQSIGDDEYEYYFLCSRDVGFSAEDFVIEVIGYCDEKRVSLCNEGMKNSILSVSRTTIDLGGSFAINFGVTCTEALARRRNDNEFAVVCENATTADIPITASAMDVEMALESLPSIIDVSVKLTDQSCTTCYQVPVASGVIGQMKSFHVSFHEIIHSMTSQVTETILMGSNAYTFDLLSKGDLPLLKIDESKLIGSQTKDSSILPEFMTSVTELVKGLDNDVSGIVAVEVSVNGGHDFSTSGVVFQYLPIAVVSKIRPHMGPTNGGTDITVYGDNFEQVPAISCLFWSSSNSGVSPVAVYAASYISRSMITCVTPPSFFVGDVFVAVSNNGVHGMSGSVDYLQPFSSKYTYYEQIQVNAVVPMSGPASGNFAVRVLGGSFISFASFHCRFGEAIVDGVFISEQEIACKSPPNRPGIQPFDIAMNGNDFTSIAHPFRYHDEIRIVEITPKSGPALAAGTVVHVRGENFQNSTSTLCRFGLSEVPAIFIDHQQLHCHSPPIDEDDLRWLALSEQYVCRTDACEENLLFPGSYHYPQYRGKIVEIEVTNNGQDFTDSGFSFLYQYDVKVKSVHNSAGPSTGGTPIFVTGENFVNNTSISCRVGQQIVKACFLTRESILCFSPAHSHADLQHPHSKKQHLAMQLRPKGAPQTVYFLEVSNNGVDFSSSGKTFEYRDSSFGGFYQPGVENMRLECPRGAYCLDHSANFTLCPMGTFQPEKGQSKCVRCTIGYMCPEEGLLTPRVCPAGYVCDVTGIERAEQPCPEGHFCLEGTATTATFCSNRLSSTLAPTLSHNSRVGEPSFNRHTSFGFRNSACWNNGTDDFGLQMSDIPARIWAELHLMPLDQGSSSMPHRGRYCLDDACMSFQELQSMSFDYSSSIFSLRRPVPCPKGTYCHPGTAVNETTKSNFTTPQPCFESMYCPEGSNDPQGLGDCPSGFYCPFSERIPCPIGTHCPRSGHSNPIPCQPGSFNGMIAQTQCTICPRGYICPGFGRIDPAICPPGFVCSSEGLKSPNIRCPAGFYCQNGTQTSDPFRNDTTLRPYPCSPGTYCLGGTGYNEMKEGDYVYAQPCHAGFYCELASTSPEGSGLCPPGFVCPKGTANPIPTPKGYFAEFAGTIEAAACLPGYYAPTIESTECYPCPPGTKCGVEGLHMAEMCPPGTYRSTLEDDGLLCVACPQGTWSKNWQLKENGECTRCPPGLFCPVDGMTSPCSSSDLPKPFEPVVNLNGIPAPEYKFSTSAMPPYFSSHECLKMNVGYEENNMDARKQEFFFGELIPPYIDVLGRGSHFRSADQDSLKYHDVAKCYHNPQRSGSLVYERMADYHGPQYDIQDGYPHQGYGSTLTMNKVFGVTPPEGFDIHMKYFHGEGIMDIDLPHARKYEPSYNCTPGFQLMNETLVMEQRIVVYTDPKNDVEGGHDVEKCPFFDNNLGCFIDPTFEVHMEGECCSIAGSTQRAIFLANDQFYPGTCEADKICTDDLISEAKPCGDGFVCDEATSLEKSDKFSCREGYFCDVGTTPDIALNAPLGQFTALCPAGSVCADKTGGGKSKSCPMNYFCPSGTANPQLGALADDALNRGLDIVHANPNEETRHLMYTTEQDFFSAGKQQSICMYSNDEALSKRYYSQVDAPAESYDDYRINAADQDASNDFSHSFRLEIVDESSRLKTKCARDNKWKFVEDAILRRECDCNLQHFVVIAVYRLWKCTATLPLEDFGFASLNVPDDKIKGTRDFWFDRVHRDYNLAIAMDESLEGLGLKWGKGKVCEWPDGEILTPMRGRIPHSKAFHFAGFDGLLSLVDNGKPFHPSVNFTIQFTWSEIRQFPNYIELKDAVYAEYKLQKQQAIDPFIFDLYHAVQLVEEFGELVEKLVYFRERIPSDFDGFVVEVDRFSNSTLNQSSIELVPGRLDACDCQNLLKCPNGTNSAKESKAISSCLKKGNEILRRADLVPSNYWSNHSNHDDTNKAHIRGAESRDIGSLHLESLEVAVFTINSTNIPNNFTYNDHYQFQIYENCKPCPTRYVCEKNVGEPSCHYPPLQRQYDYLNQCLREHRKNVCVNSDGKHEDVSWCLAQRDMFEDGIYPAWHPNAVGNTETIIPEDDKEYFESTYLIYTQPDLVKCLQMPFFCEDMHWQKKVFRQLCQDVDNTGNKGPIYDCDLAKRYEEYVRWRDHLCCSNEELLSFGACHDDKCNDTGEVEEIIRSKHVDMYITNGGYTPEGFKPAGTFLMDRQKQEDKQNSAPLDLFVEDSQDIGNDGGGHTPQWLSAEGCCRCTGHPLPEFFDSATANKGFPDTKHQELQITISAIEAVNLTFVAELLHGSYYMAFDDHFGSNNVTELHIHTPHRADFNPHATSASQRSAWLAIIEKSDFSHTELPLNLPQKRGTASATREFENVILVDHAIAYPGDKVFVSQSNIVRNSTIYDDDGILFPSPNIERDKIENIKLSESWWEDGDQTKSTGSSDFSFIALPYFPFFSNCNEYGSHMSISRLLEEHPDCEQIDFSKTEPVSQMSWFSSSKPVGDTCEVSYNQVHYADGKQVQPDIFKGVDLSCAFEEDVSAPAEKLRWFEVSGGTTLFHLTKEPQKPEAFEAKKRDDTLIIEHRWGRSPELARIRATDQLIPVVIDEIKAGIQHTIPRKVKLELQYYQVQKSRKRLVQAVIFLDDLCTTLKPLHAGGNEVMLNMMLSQGIHPCEIDINGNMISFDYTLEVHFFPLNWFHLFNQFEFNVPLYLGFFFLVGVTSVGLASIVWAAHRLTTKLRHPPVFHGWALMKFISAPSSIGCTLGCIPYVICTFVIFFWLGNFSESRFSSSTNPTEMSSVAFEDVHGDWLDTSALDSERIKLYRVGRIGAALFALGLYATALGASLVIPNKSNGARSHEEMSISDSSSGNADNEAIESFESSFVPNVWKRAHLIWTSLCIEFILICFLEFSYSSTFERNVYCAVVLFKALQIIIDAFIGEFLQEKLMDIPLVVVLKLIEILITMGASDFVDFTFTYFVVLSMMIIERMYIGPVVKYMKIFWPRWKMILQRKMFRKTIRTPKQKQEDEAKWKRINDEIEMKSESIESLLDSYGTYSVEVISGLLSPIVNIFLMVFFHQIEIPAKYGIRTTEMGYFTLFVGFMIPWRFAVDMFVINAQELIHGWRVYDYIAYQKYRYVTRDHRWILPSTFPDESITPSMQTIDVMCFSDQYYFLSSLFSLAMMSNIFAVTIFLRAQYNILGDPAAPLIMLVIFGLCEVTQSFLRFLADAQFPWIGWRGLWTTKHVDTAMDVEIAAKLTIGEGRRSALERERIELQALNSESFRHRFLDRNRAWIMQHLEDILTPRSMKSVTSEGEVEEYVRDVYARLIAMGEGARKLGDRSDISSDEDDEMEYLRREWTRIPFEGKNLSIAKLWLQKARKRRLFSKVVAGITKSKLDNKCSFCARRQDAPGTKLVVGLATDGRFDSAAMDEIIRKFEQKYSASEQDLDLWKAFFRSNGEFATSCNICIDCGKHNQIQRTMSIQVPGPGPRISRANDISSDEEDDDDIGTSFDPLSIPMDSNEGKMLTKWLQAARTKLGGTDVADVAQMQTESYLKRMSELSQKAKLRTPAYTSLSENVLSTASKLIAIKWVESSRQSMRNRFNNHGILMRSKLKTLMSQIEEEDDWFYGAEFRIEGGNLLKESSDLHKEFSLCSQRVETKILAESNSFAKFEEEIHQELQRKRESAQQQCKRTIKEQGVKLEERLSELRLLSVAKEDSNNAAQPDVDDLMIAEKEKAGAIIKAARLNLSRDLNKVESKILASIDQRRQALKREKEKIERIGLSKVELAEKSWRKRVIPWIESASRKIDSKQTNLS
uniref:IPT/TIG domain-containing protein n=1 Tax=Leptocylindrus danicus TaxID=163516 RepID=A0A7S2LSA9_9STRA